MKKIVDKIRKFRNDRDWSKFHTPENLSKAISIEAGELLEHFLWDNNYDKEEVCDELADVMIYCINMADSLGVDIEKIIDRKMDKNEKKYPVENVKETVKSILNYRWCQMIVYSSSKRNLCCKLKMTQLLVQ